MDKSRQARRAEARRVWFDRIRARYPRAPRSKVRALARVYATGRLKAEFAA